MNTNDFKLLLKDVIKDIAPNDHECAENLALLYKKIEEDGLNSMIYQKINNNLFYYSVQHPEKNTENIIKLQQIVLKKIQVTNGILGSTIWFS